MALSESTTLRIKIGSAISLIVVCCGIAITGYRYKVEITETHRAVQDARNWLFTVIYPTHPFSKNWTATHRWGDFAEEDREEYHYTSGYAETRTDRYESAAPASGEEPAAPATGNADADGPR